jgi:MFS family permease
MAEEHGSRRETSREELLRTIVRKREQLDRYLASTSSRQHRLLNLSIIAGAVAAALTAAPALGGPTLTDWLDTTFHLSSPSWRLLCAAAAVCSVSATIATQLLKSHNLEEHIARAEAVRAKLETLEIGLSSGQVSNAHAGAEFMKCVESAAFVHEVTDGAPGGASHRASADT